MTDISMPVRKAHELLRKMAICTSTRMLEREVLKEVVEENRRRFFGCLMLPITLLFFVFFAISSVLHEDVGQKHMLLYPVLSALNDPNSPALDAVTTISDVWNYINTTAMPLFLQSSDIYGVELTKDDKGKFFAYNQVLGGIFLSTQRSQQQPCAGGSLSNNLMCHPQTTISTDKYGLPIQNLFEPDKPASYWYGALGLYPGGTSNYAETKEQAKVPNTNYSILLCSEEGFIAGDGCYKDENATEVDVGLINIWEVDAKVQRRLAQLDQELKSNLPDTADPKGKSFKFYLSTNTSLEVNQERLNYLQQRGWIDVSTNWVKLEVLIYNYQLEIPRVMKVTQNFIMSRGGGVYTSMSLQVSSLKTFSNPYSLLVDILFMITCAISSANLAREFIEDLKEVNRSFFGNLANHFSPVNVLTYLSCVVGWGLMAFMFSLEVNRKTAIAYLQYYEDNPSKAASEKVITATAAVASSADIFRILVGYAHILFMARCFTALKWQPRLAVITESLGAATVELFHTMIVMITIFCGFAVAAMIMFGNFYEYFTSIGTAFNRCFVLTIEKQFDWFKFEQQDYFTAMLFSWPYMLVMVLIMLNIVLGIICDSYSEVQKMRGYTMTIWEHADYILKRMILNKHWVKDHDLLVQIEEMPQTILVSELRQVFPKIPQYQLDFLCRQTTNKSQVVQREGIAPMYVLQMVAAINVALDEILADLVKLERRGWLGSKGLEVKNDGDRECVKEILSGIAVQRHWMELTQNNLTSLQMKMLASEEKKPLDSTKSNGWKTVKKVDMLSPSNSPRKRADD